MSPKKPYSTKVIRVPSRLAPYFAELARIYGEEMEAVAAPFEDDDRAPGARLSAVNSRILERALVAGEYLEQLEDSLESLQHDPRGRAGELADFLAQWEQEFTEEPEKRNRARWSKVWSLLQDAPPILEGLLRLGRLL
jgi:hypothetical protein